MIYLNYTRRMLITLVLIFCSATAFAQAPKVDVAAIEKLRAEIALELEDELDPISKRANAVYAKAFEKILQMMMVDLAPSKKSVVNSIVDTALIVEPYEGKVQASAYSPASRIIRIAAPYLFARSIPYFISLAHEVTHAIQQATESDVFDFLKKENLSLLDLRKKHRIEREAIHWEWAMLRLIPEHHQKALLDQISRYGRNAPAWERVASRGVQGAKYSNPSDFHRSEAHLRRYSRRSIFEGSYPRLYDWAKLAAAAGACGALAYAMGSGLLN